MKTWHSGVICQDSHKWPIHCCCSVTKTCLTLCNPMDCGMPGLSVPHYLPEFAQVHVHQVGDAIHLILCRPLLLLPSIFPSSRVFSNALVLCIRWTGWISLQSKRHSRVFSNTTVQKFSTTHPSLWSNSNIHT